MKRKDFLSNVMLSSLGFASAGTLANSFKENFQETNEGGTRSKVLFNHDWRFHLGDVSQAKTPVITTSPGEN